MPDKPEPALEPLQMERLLSGDRPSIITLGAHGAHALRQHKLAVFAVDVVGRVHMLPPSAVKLLAPPRVQDSELDEMTEDEAIDIMASQSDPEEAILKYLTERKGRESNGSSL
jgi:hypothetical protein